MLTPIKDDYYFFEQLKSGSPRAFKKLYEDNISPCLRRAISRGLYYNSDFTRQYIQQDFDEIYCEAIEVVINNITNGKYEYQGKLISSYVLQVFDYKLSDYFRRKTKDEERFESYEPNLETDDDEENDVISNESGEDDNSLLAIFNDEVDTNALLKLHCVKQIMEGDELSEECKKMLICQYVEGNKLKTCAENLGYSTTFGKVKQARCRNEFKELYQICVNTK